MIEKSIYLMYDGCMQYVYILYTLFEVIVCDVSNLMTLRMNSVFPTISISLSPFFDEPYGCVRTSTDFLSHLRLRQIQIFTRSVNVLLCLNATKKKQTQINPSYKSCRILF